MIRSRLPALLTLLTLGFSLGLPLPARAENPLEKLHKKIFGDDDRKKDDKKKDKDRDHKNDYDHRRYEDQRYENQRYEDRRYDDRRYDDRRSYRQEPVVVERRVYVEPAPRPYYEPAPRSSYGTRSIEVDVQLALRRQGYYRGPIDGDLGPGTRSAIRDYQIDRRLPATGRIDNYLVRSLGL